MDWIPGTKFIPPQLPDVMLERSLLLATLHEAVTSRRLTLVSAQAGAGKTTLVASLPVAYPNLPLAWISLDSSDDDPFTFLTLIIKAIYDLLPDCVLTTAELVANPDTTVNPQRVVGVLINELLACDASLFVLVLDDLHTISDPQVLQTLDYLLEHLPAVMHILVTTRHDPAISLARLRARGQLAELRMDQLRFDETETAALLQEVLGFSLAEEEIAVLDSRTEGWIAALCLSALSMSDLTPRARKQFLVDFGAGSEFVFDYLAEEVLRRQPQEMRQFLLQTSILEELTPALCIAVTQQEQAATYLLSAYRQNLFLARSSQSTAGSSYRYHALFRRFLHAELELRFPSQLPHLHQRAASALGDSRQAVRHCLDGGLWPEAADRIETLYLNARDRGFINPVFGQWLARMPREIIKERPWLSLIAGGLLIERGHVGDAKADILNALETFRLREDRRGELRSLLYLIQTSPGNEMEYVPKLEQFMQQYPEIATATERASYHNVLFWSAVYSLQWPKATSQLRAAVKVIAAADDRGPFQLAALQMTPPLCFTDDALQPVRILVAGFKRRFPDEEGLMRMGSMAGQSLLALYEGRLAQAESTAKETIALCRLFGETAWVELTTHYILGQAQLAMGIYAPLETYLSSLLIEIAPKETMQSRRNDILSLLSLAFWYQGKINQMEEVYAEMQRFSFWPEQEVQTKICAGILALEAGNKSAAAEQFSKARDNQRHARLMMAADARLYLALVYWLDGRREAAVREMAVILAEMQNTGMLGIVLFCGAKIMPVLKATIAAGLQVEAAQYCLDAFGEPTAPRSLAIPGSSERLTPRETEVLHLIAAGLSNRAIAAQLVVSERTVKSHVTHILAKLQDQSRTQAVSRARELGLPL